MLYYLIVALLFCNKSFPLFLQLFKWYRSACFLHVLSFEYFLFDTVVTTTMSVEYYLFGTDHHLIMTPIITFFAFIRAFSIMRIMPLVVGRRQAPPLGALLSALTCEGLCESCCEGRCEGRCEVYVCKTSYKVYNIYKIWIIETWYIIK